MFDGATLEAGNGGTLKIKSVPFVQGIKARIRAMGLQVTTAVIITLLGLGKNTGERNGS